MKNFKKLIRSDLERLERLKRYVKNKKCFNKKDYLYLNDVYTSYLKGVYLYSEALPPQSKLTDVKIECVVPGEKLLSRKL